MGMGIILPGIIPYLMGIDLFRHFLFSSKYYLWYLYITLLVYHGVKHISVLNNFFKSAPDAVGPEIEQQTQKLWKIPKVLLFSNIYLFPTFYTCKLPKTISFFHNHI